MPIREFECEDCGYIKEYIMFHKSKLTAIKCDECGGKAKLIISAANICMKGQFTAKTGYSHQKEAKKDGGRNKKDN